MNKKHNAQPYPSFTEEQILFLLQRVDILNFLEQSCSYIPQFLRSGRLLKMAIYQPFAMPLVMPQPGFSRVGYNLDVICMPGFKSNYGL